MRLLDRKSSFNQGYRSIVHAAGILSGLRPLVLFPSHTFSLARSSCRSQVFSQFSNFPLLSLQIFLRPLFPAAWILTSIKTSLRVFSLASVSVAMPCGLSCSCSCYCQTRILLRPLKLPSARFLLPVWPCLAVSLAIVGTLPSVHFLLLQVLLRPSRFPRAWQVRRAPP